MGLLDDLTDSKNFKEPTRMKCKVCELLKELPPNESAALLKRLTDSKSGHTAISDVLIKNGYLVSRSAISRHRKDTHVVK